jgi:anti-sigma B factor antagonist
MGEPDAVSDRGDAVATGETRAAREGPEARESEARESEARARSDGGAPPQVVKIIGELDVSNAHRLRALLADIRTPSPTIVVDMSELAFMDSSGLTVLLEASRRGATIVLRHPSPVVRRLVEITGLTDILHVEDG